MRSVLPHLCLACALLLVALTPGPGQDQEGGDPLARLGPGQMEELPLVGPVYGPPLSPYVKPPVAPRRKPAPLLVVTPPPPPPPPVPEPRFEPDSPIGLSFAYPARDALLPEGDTVMLVWNTGGPIKSVRLSYEGELCPLGGRSRGTFRREIATTSNKGVYRWRVPWMDAAAFTLRLVGLSDKGKELTRTATEFSLLPLVCQNRPPTAICVSKSRQRLYYLREGQIRRMHVISTAAPGFWTPVMRPGSYDRQRGAMGRVFSKAYAPVSRMYEVVMYNWMAITSSGSHGIHATSPAFYSRLGRPASHGCIRQHRTDARILWEMVRVGTPVYVM